MRVHNIMPSERTADTVVYHNLERQCPEVLGAYKNVNILVTLYKEVHSFVTYLDKTYNQTFKIGDAVLYDKREVHSIGQLMEVSQTMVKIKTNSGGTWTALNLARFIQFNFDLNIDASYAHNKQILDNI